MTNEPIKCPHCQNEDKTMMEEMNYGKYVIWLCHVCSKTFEVK